MQGSGLYSPAALCVNSFRFDTIKKLQVSFFLVGGSGCYCPSNDASDGKVNHLCGEQQLSLCVCTHMKCAKALPMPNSLFCAVAIDINLMFGNSINQLKQIQIET